jgi:hypothetical protein
MSFTLFDFRPPNVSSKQDCNSIQGMVHDSSSTDSGIKSVEVESQQNVQVNIGDIIGYPDSVAFSGTIVDQYSDASFTLIAKDSAGYSTRKKFDIPGFTVLVKGDTIPIAIRKDGPIKREFCFPITLTNTGAFTQVIDRIKIVDVGPVQVRLNSQLPITIAPGQSLDISICAIGDSIGIDSARIILENECASRHVVDLVVTTNQDITPPIIITEKSDCGIPVTFFVSDETIIDSGLDSIIIDDQNTINCDVKIERNGDRATVSVTVIDQFQDAKYVIFVTDKAGNRRVLSDSVRGLTISIQDLEGNEISFIAFDSTALGLTRCDSIVIENTGRFALNIPHIFMSRNLAFSIPVSQMPLTLDAGEKQTLAVCYHPLMAANEIDSMETDTMGIYYGCSEKLIPLTGIGTQIIGSNSTNCDIILRSEIVTLPGLVSGPYPHPIHDQGNIDIAMNKAGQLSIRMRNAFNSMQTKQLHNGYLMSGTYTISFSTEEFTSGLWTLEIIMPEGIQTIPVMIAK